MTSNLRPRETDYDGERKRDHHLTLTDTAWDELGRLSSLLGISRSEFVERMARKLLPAKVYKKDKNKSCTGVDIPNLPA
jgi:metal-responsive CopG/Arc/MetJ family transcriptional regulator